MVKAGDRVRIADNKNTRMMHSGMPECYPEPGSLGTVDKRTPHQQRLLGQVGQPPG